MLSRKNMLASGAVGLFVGAFLGYFAWLLYDAEQTYLSWPVVPGRVLEMSIESRRAAKGKNHLYWQVSPRCSELVVAGLVAWRHTARIGRDLF